VPNRRCCEGVYLESAHGRHVDVVGAQQIRCSFCKRGTVPFLKLGFLRWQCNAVPAIAGILDPDLHFATQSVAYSPRPVGEPQDQAGEEEVEAGGGVQGDQDNDRGGEDDVDVVEGVVVDAAEYW